MTQFNCWMCRHSNVSQCTDNIIIDSILEGEYKKLECPICYEEFDHNNLFFTECKHYACFDCVDNIRQSNSESMSVIIVISPRPTITTNDIIQIYNYINIIHIINNINNLNTLD